jgi:hypothetical protein
MERAMFGYEPELGDDSDAEDARQEKVRRAKKKYE